jgi:hypothetical protein
VVVVDILDGNALASTTSKTAKPTNIRNKPMISSSNYSSAPLHNPASSPDIHNSTSMPVSLPFIRPLRKSSKSRHSALPVFQLPLEKFENKLPMWMTVCG